MRLVSDGRPRGRQNVAGDAERALRGAARQPAHSARARVDEQRIVAVAAGRGRAEQPVRGGAQSDVQWGKECARQCANGQGMLHVGEEFGVGVVCRETGVLWYAQLVGAWRRDFLQCAQLHDALLLQPLCYCRHPRSDSRAEMVVFEKLREERN
jgi:hypothetical protein